MLLSRKRINCVQKWALPRKEKEMTYIIAGNLNDINFLMVDSIGNGTDKKVFNEKMFKLNSEDDLYTTLSGDNQIMNFLTEYDNWAAYENKNVDYSNKNTIEEIIKKMLNSNYLNSLANYQLSEITTLYFI